MANFPDFDIPDYFIEDARSDFLTRATLYWPKFCQRIVTPVDVVDDAKTFHGLFDEQHKWAADYLVAFAREDLVKLQMSFDMKMAQLDADDQIAVLQLASQRYANSVDDAVERISIALHGKQIDVQRSKVAAREYAMTSDRARVVTMQAAVDNAIAKSNARIKELQAEIDTLVVEMQMVQADILTKELEAEKAKLEYLRAVQRALQIKQDIAEIGLEKAKVESEVARIESDIVKWDVQVAESAAEIQELLAQKKRLETELAQVVAKELDAQADAADYAYRKADLDTKRIELQSEVDKINAEVQSIAARVESTQARTTAVVAQRSEVAANVAQIKADVKQVEADINKADVEIARAKLSEADATMAEAEAEIEKMRSTQYWPKKAEAARKNAASYASLSEAYKKLVPLQREIASEMAALQEQRYDLQVQDVETESKLYGLDADANIRINNIYANAAKAEANAELDVATEETKVWDARERSSSLAKTGAIQSAEMMSKAEIVNHLTHSIAGA